MTSQTNGIKVSRFYGYIGGDNNRCTICPGGRGGGGVSYFLLCFWGQGGGGDGGRRLRQRVMQTTLIFYWDGFLKRLVDVDRARDKIKYVHIRG